MHDRIAEFFRRGLKYVHWHCNTQLAPGLTDAVRRPSSPPKAGLGAASHDNKWPAKMLLSTPAGTPPTKTTLALTWLKSCIRELTVHAMGDLPPARDLLQRAKLIMPCSKSRGF